ncbi:MAG: hypothetical protein ACU0DX_00240 [Roseovarius sp.]|uniref:hypothetical protein n=1 Tax=Roseovarius sp. TaxID=1486281 RepID=UPI004058A908
MTQRPFNPFSGSGLGGVPKGWIAVADVYARIALDFFNQLGPGNAEGAPLSKLAGPPPDRHDAHATPYFLTWRVLSYCKQVARLEEDGNITALNDLTILRPRDKWDSANAHMSLPEGCFGTGVDEQNSPLKEGDLAACGYTKKQPILVRVADIYKGRSEVLLERHGRGRPKKGPLAALAYRERFPQSHQEEDMTNEEAALEISEIIGERVSWKTINRHLCATSAERLGE